VKSSAMECDVTMWVYSHTMAHYRASKSQSHVP